MNQQPNVTGQDGKYPPTTAVLPGSFSGGIFALVITANGTAALLGVTAAHTSQRALWAGIKGSHADYVQVMGQSYKLDHNLDLVKRGEIDGVEWTVRACPNVVVATEESVRAYAGKEWPLPPWGSLLDLLMTYQAETVIGEGRYLVLPAPHAGIWKGIISRLTRPDAGEVV